MSYVLTAVEFKLAKQDDPEDETNDDAVIETYWIGPDSDCQTGDRTEVAMRHYGT